MNSDRRDIVPYDDVVAALASRDLESCISPSIVPIPKAPRLLGVKLYEPVFWSRFGKFLDELRNGRAQSPTYKAVTARGDLNALMLTLAQQKAIADRSVGDLVDGWTKIPALDQLALSGLDNDKVIRLGQSGYGLWPIQEGLDLSKIDLDALKLKISREQLDLLSRGSNITSRAIRGLWFQDERLVGKERPTPEDYLPTLVETLSAFENFYHQEGFFPHSRGKWLATRSTIPVSLTSAYDQVFYDRDPKSIFLNAFLGLSGERGEYRQYLDHQGNFYRKYSEGNDVTKKDESLRVRHMGNLVFSADKNGNMYLKLSEGDNYSIKNGVFEAYKMGVLVASYSVDDLVAELADHIARTRDRFTGSFLLGVAVKSDVKKGIQVGANTAGINSEVRWNVGNGAMSVDYFSALVPYINRQVNDLTLVNGAVWPRIFPDEFAGEVLK